MTLTLTRPHGRTSTDTLTPPPTDRGRAWLTRLFAGDFAFPAVQPAALAPADRPPAEADAAARAAGCRDLFVLDAPERPSRERVLADVARAAALKGERVLLLSPDAAAADRLVEMLAPTGSVVRALADDENPYRSSAVVNRLTAANAGAAHADKVVREAMAPAAAVEGKFAPLAAVAGLVPGLRERAARFEQLQAERAALEADTADPLAELRAGHEAAVGRLKAERDGAQAKRAEKEAELAAVRQHCADASDAAKKTGFFSRLLGKTKSAGDPAELERHAADLEREIKELAAREATLAAECDHAAAAFAAECERVRAAHAADRTAKFAAVAAEADAISAAFRADKAAFDAAGLAAPWPTAQSLDATVAALTAARASAERELASARERAATLDRAALAREFLTAVRVVVGTPGCLNAEAVFAPPGDSPPFGVLILDHAEELGEADFADLSRVAERWVLAGNAAMPEEPKPGLNGAHRPRRPAGPTFVARLARLLDREPWAAEPDRLVCRLAHVPPDRRRALFREPVVDDPRIELRFAEGEGREALLAEVAFPAGTPVATAKAFLAGQLGEAALRPLGEVKWHHDADRVTACWPAADHGPVAWVDHEAGVREKVAGVGAFGFTAAVSFDTSAGWDADKAAAWVADRLPAPPSGRVAVLPRDPSVPAGTTPRAAGV